MTESPGRREGRALPPELAGDAPRALPPAFEHGPLARRQRRIAWGLGIASAVCVLLGLMPWVKTLALYILPLRYLVWIGAALATGGAVSHLTRPEMRKAARYIREGTVGWARVQGLVKTPTAVVNGQPSQHAFVATLQVLHPDTRQGPSN